MELCLHEQTQIVASAVCREGSQEFHSWIASLPLAYFADDAWWHTAPEGECVYIKQSTCSCIVTNMLHFQHSKICPNPIFNTPLLYTVKDSAFDCGMLL